jgi:hypothetical protein
MHLRGCPLNGTTTRIKPTTSDMSGMSERSTSVTLRFTRWRGPWSRAVPLALAAALMALPAAANDATTATTSTTTPATQVSLRQIAASEAGRTRLARTTTRRAAQGTKESRGFFKSRPGALAIAVMAAGTGYAVYSLKHDRITSPGKQ